jgi:hypothetical protein
MSSPALYFTSQSISHDKKELLQALKKVMTDSGLVDVKVKGSHVAGRTATVHAFIALELKQKAAPATPGQLPAPSPTFIVFFVAAGADAKAVLTTLTEKWSKVGFL